MLPARELDASRAGRESHQMVRFPASAFLDALRLGPRHAVRGSGGSASGRAWGMPTMVLKKPSDVGDKCAASSLNSVDDRQHSTRSRSNPGGIADVLSVLGPDVIAHRSRKPPWFKVPAPGGPRYRELQTLISEEQLHTVCQEAACPNIGECWQRGHGHLHDPRGHVHPALRVLQCEDRQADLERSAGAGPGGAFGGQDGPPARRHHQCRPGRSAGLRGVRVCRASSGRSAGSRHGPRSRCSPRTSAAPRCRWPR